MDSSSGTTVNISETLTMLWTYQTDEMQKLFQILLQNGRPGELYQPFKITFIIFFLTLLAYAKLASTILLPMWDKRDLFLMELLTCVVW